MTLGTS